MNITDPIRHNAAQSPESAAIIRRDGTTVSYRELDRTIDFVAGGARVLGLVPGKLVGVISASAYRGLCAALALARLGVGAVRIQVHPDDINVNVDTWLTDGEVPAQAAAKHVPLDRLWPRGVPIPVDVPQVTANEDGSVLCAAFPTSGTTGVRKFVAVSHDAVARRIAAAVADLESAEEIRHICTIGAGTSYGFTSRLGVLWRGGTVVIQRGIEQILAAIEQHGVTHLTTAPATIQRLVSARPPGIGPLPSLRRVEVGGAHMTKRLYDVARERICPNIVCRYGASETGPIAVATMESLQGHPGAVGYVYPGVEVQATDADAPLPPGSEGVLRIRSPARASGYLGDPAGSGEVFRGEWVYPGDVGTVSSDGLLTITGRAGDIINRGGDKINPRVIEDALLSIDEIEDAAAFGVPDALGVMRIWAAIVPRVRVEGKALKALCIERLKDNAPTGYLIVKELPRNDSGKVLRDKLKQMAARARARRAASVRSG